MLTDRHRPPSTDPPPPRARVGTPPSAGRAHGRALVARVTVALAVAVALSSQGLVTTAERQGFGARRTIALGVADALDEQASALWLDRPAALVRSASGRANEPVVARGADEPAPVPPSAAAATAGPNGSSGAADGSDRAPTASTSATAGGQRPPSPSTAGPPPAAPPPSIPTTTAPQPTIRPIGPERKLRIWAGGDSLGEYIGNHLLGALADPELVTVQLDYRISTGLARPDYYDWPARMTAIASVDPPPDVIVYMVGGNDNQDMADGGEVLTVGTEPWFDAYEARVASIVDAADPTATHVYWIGLPPMRDGVRHELAIGMNEVMRRVSEQRANMTYLDLGQLFAGPDGEYRAHLAAPDGQLRLARQADGVHITFAGSTWIAAIVWDLIAARWAIDEPAGQEDPASTPILDVPS